MEAGMSNRTRISWALALVTTILLALSLAAPAERPKPTELTAECSPFTDAKKHIGQKSCIRGQVLRVEHSAECISYLNFCEDYRACPFTVVVFAEDQHHVGALETLVGRTIEINGKVRDYACHAEIVLQDSAQLGGEFKRLPPVPKEFDVEQQGKFSAGTFHAPKNRKPSRKKAKLPTTINVEDGFDE
jgi:hypothetical protein